MNAIAYLRQSTIKQERSGLSILAQRKACADLARARGLTIEAEYVETESGTKTGSARPKLEQALNTCRKTGKLLIISTLSRLARNASFTLSLRDSGVDFLCCDMPDATRLTIGIMAVLAEDEARLISKRTSDALQAKKRQCEANGVPFFQGQREAARRVHALSVQAMKDNASRRHSERKPGIVGVFQTSGEQSYTKTARILTDLRVPTLTGQGASWTATGVRRVVLRG